MKIDIRSKDIVLNKPTQEQIRRKLKFALSRLEPYIKTISVYLSNISDSEHSNNNHCQLKISVTNMPDVIIEDIQVELSNVIDRVIQKATRIMNRKLEIEK